MTTAIKIDFDDDGKATHVRVNGKLLPGATCDLSKIDALLSVIDDVHADEVLVSVEDALQANLVTLQEAERIKKRERRLDALLVQKRAEVASLDAQLAEASTVKAIVDKKAVLAALTRDVADVVAIVEKKAALAAVDAVLVDHQDAVVIVEKKTEIVRLDTVIVEKKTELAELTGEPVP